MTKPVRPRHPVRAAIDRLISLETKQDRRFARSMLLLVTVMSFLLLSGFRVTS